MKSNLSLKLLEVKSINITILNGSPIILSHFSLEKPISTNEPGFERLSTLCESAFIHAWKVCCEFKVKRYLLTVEFGGLLFSMRLNHKLCWELSREITTNERTVMNWFRQKSRFCEAVAITQKITWRSEMTGCVKLIWMSSSLWWNNSKK